jgi:TolB-like protein
MSPEQARGEALDARTDVFSCGAVLYEMATGRQPFSGGTSAVIFDAILNRAPISPVKLNPELPAELERIVNTALEKDRDLRYQSAAELKTDLKRLKRNSDSAKSGKTIAAAAVPPSASPRARWKAPAVAAALLIAAAAIGWWARSRSPRSAAAAATTTLAVLPFQNLGADAAADYLRLALPDEVITTLSYIPTLAIRPFAATQKFAQGPVDPQAAGRELRVARVLTGHFQREGDQLRVTLEVIDTESNRLVWRDTSSSAAGNLIGLREQISTRMRQGLFPLLGSGIAAAEAATRPKNAEAYDLYLRSKSLSSDAEPNDRGVAMLERSVGLDPTFAPAWAALSLRYYYQGAYGRDPAGAPHGPETAPALYARAKDAVERALVLDPNLVDAVRNSIVYETEAGNIQEADRKARDFVARRPEDGEARFALSYVLRYAGLLEQAGRECEAAVAADPHNRGFRSCAFVFMQLGNYDRARDFLRLDAGSEWSRGREGNILHREGRTEAAAALFEATGFERVAELVRGSGTPAERERASAALEAFATADRDPENKYYMGAMLASSGYEAAGLRLLRRAVEDNYLSYPAMDTDPLYESVRKNPEFAAIRAEAIRRQKEFLAARGATEP